MSQHECEICEEETGTIKVVMGGEEVWLCEDCHDDGDECVVCHEHSDNVGLWVSGDEEVAVCVDCEDHHHGVCNECQKVFEEGKRFVNKEDDNRMGLCCECVKQGVKLSEDWECIDTEGEWCQICGEKKAEDNRLDLCEYHSDYRQCELCEDWGLTGVGVNWITDPQSDDDGVCVCNKCEDKVDCDYWCVDKECDIRCSECDEYVAHSEIKRVNGNTRFVCKGCVEEE